MRRPALLDLPGIASGPPRNQERGARPIERRQTHRPRQTRACGSAFGTARETLATRVDASVSHVDRQTTGTDDPREHLARTCGRPLSPGGSRRVRRGRRRSCRSSEAGVPSVPTETVATAEAQVTGRSGFVGVKRLLRGRRLALAGRRTRRASRRSIAAASRGVRLIRIPEGLRDAQHWSDRERA